MSQEMQKERSWCPEKHQRGKITRSSVGRLYSFLIYSLLSWKSTVLRIPQSSGPKRVKDLFLTGKLGVKG